MNQLETDSSNGGDCVKGDEKFTDSSTFVVLKESFGAWKCSVSDA